jgi:5-methyltetrahydrofolate--homocysteine methyltransferase
LPIKQEEAMADYEALKQTVIDGNAARVKEMTQRALNEGRRPQEILDSALISAMDVVGDKFARGELFIPEMLVSARAMQAGLALLKPLLVAGESKTRGKVVIGTVKGDLHDIGKNLVAMFLQGGGFEVVDLGTDVKPSRFVEAVQVEKPDFVMMSALLTTTMLAMKETIEALKASGLRDKVRIGIGGAPVTQRFAEEVGADFYAADATAAVAKARGPVSARS